MHTVTGAPSQVSQPSRKGKKAWRKNVDISQVQSGLEALRNEIVQHGKPLAEKAQDELFALDTQGSEEISRRVKEGRVHKAKKTLKADEILGRRSAVPALENGKTGNKRAHALTTDGVLDAANKRQKKDWVSKKEVARLRSNLDKTSHLDTENLDGDASTFDLWDQATAVDKTGTPQDGPVDRASEYIPKPRAKVPPPSIRRAPVAMTASGKPVRAVSQPDAGTSYNPSFDDWETLLTRAGEQEVALESARLREATVAAEREARVQALAAQPDPSPQDEEESAWEGFETENEHDGDEVSARALLRQKRPERKTPAQRNKAKRRKEAERQAKHEARMGDRQKRAAELVQALILARRREARDEAGELVADPAQENENETETTLRRRTTLGPSSAPIPPAALELVLPDELQESLRRLKPEGNLLGDRFRNLLVNGKLEARKPVLYAKTKKVKYTEKWWAKDFKIGV